MLEVENLIERAFDIVKCDERDADAVGEVFKDIQKSIRGRGDDFRDLTIGTFWDMAVGAEFDQGTMNFLNAQTYRL